MTSGAICSLWNPTVINKWLDCDQTLKMVSVAAIVKKQVLKLWSLAPLLQQDEDKMRFLGFILLETKLLEFECQVSEIFAQQIFGKDGKNSRNKICFSH